eukprot:10245283-Lingulodinium_polyedra.AAC.1
MVIVLGLAFPGAAAPERSSSPAHGGPAAAVRRAGPAGAALRAAWPRKNCGPRPQAPARAH